jgi:outer membrane protein OmpA-like peptidoglycan-associated protein
MKSHRQKLRGDQPECARERRATEGVGMLAPLASNDAESGRSKNRRVELVPR